MVIEVRTVATASGFPHTVLGPLQSSIHRSNQSDLKMAIKRCKPQPSHLLSLPFRSRPLTCKIPCGHPQGPLGFCSQSSPPSPQGLSWVGHPQFHEGLYASLCAVPSTSPYFSPINFSTMIFFSSCKFSFEHRFLSTALTTQFKVYCSSLRALCSF